MTPRYEVSRLWVWIIAGTFLAASGYAYFLGSHPAYRASLEHAGDIALPGKHAFRHPDHVKQFVTNAGDAHAAYKQLLALDFGLAVLIPLFFLSIAAATGKLGLRKRSAMLAVTAVLAAVCDCIENWLLFEALASTGIPTELAWAITCITTLKWTFLYASLALGLFGLMRLIGSGHAWWSAFFQDVPYIVDALWRRADFVVNREFLHAPGASRLDIERRLWHKPAFLLLALTIVFISYGPTADGFCTIASQDFTRILPMFPAIAAVLGIGYIWPRFQGPINVDLNDRFLRLEENGVDADEIRQRKAVSEAAVWAGVVLLVVPLGVAGWTLLQPAFVDSCDGAQFSERSLLRAGLCAGAIFAFAFLTPWMKGTAELLRLQAAIAAGTAVILWVFLATSQATEASGLPYRHVYAVVAPALLLVLWAAPWVASAYFRPAEWLKQKLGATETTPEAKEYFQRKLLRKDVFMARGGDGYLAPSRVAFALFQGVSARALQIAVVPALFAFVAAPQYLTVLTVYGIVLSLLLSIWGNMSRRWQQLASYVDRWYLSGTALYVSIFVIVVAGARLLDIDYVTTILDAAPFGVVFAFVVMSYVLSWLLDYWIQRVLADELLVLLGNNTGQSRMLWTPPRNRQNRNDRVKDGEARVLSYHAIGRFLVVGHLLARPGRSAYAGHLQKFCDPETAFHSYDLLELFGYLAGRDSDFVAEVVRRSNLYRYTMNGALLALFLALVACTWQHSRMDPDVVIEAYTGTEVRGTVNLPDKLLATPDQAHSAIVMVASGGGTRAALYTSHVLQGLHALGADRDVVLASGVSGGGVALAYFTAHYPQLVHGATQDKWDDFRMEVGGNLISDVLEGFTEWRIFGKAPLSVLLVESFERHLFEQLRDPTLRLPGGPGLILNATISGHPAEDSETLAVTLNPAPGGTAAGCRERARVYKVMNGGRLIFTNLQHTSEFPTRQSEIPDTRLPYVVVQDGAVRLSHAAALNANFPPVFPNAHVRLMGVRKEDSECPNRSYFVTDGGALENLGLVSALYAVQSALHELETHCGSACKLRPIDFVIAEASGTSYDYAQDRGVSAGFAGAKERAIGGLTEMLVTRTRDLYDRRGGDPELVRFHYLPLPLAFRARGGFGTHWMHAPEIKIADPRDREWPNWFERKLLNRPATVSLSTAEVRDIWLNLHDSDAKYCEKSDYGSIDTDRVRRWICGTLDQRLPRDLHVVGWDRIVKTLKR